MGSLCYMTYEGIGCVVGPLNYLLQVADTMERSPSIELLSIEPKVFPEWRSFVKRRGVG